MLRRFLKFIFFSIFGFLIFSEQIFAKYDFSKPNESNNSSGFKRSKSGEFGHIQSREDFFQTGGNDELPSNFHRLPRPKKFHSNNNLLKLSNKNIYPVGRKAVLEGYIIDQNSVPIPNAVVKIWQKNNFGIYQDDFNKKKLMKGGTTEIQRKLNHYNESFTGSGVATTDNTGYFHFITLIPCDDAAYEMKCIPEIEISVQTDLKNYNGFEGRILIPEVDRNSENKLTLLNKYYFPEDYVSELKEFGRDFYRFRNDIQVYEKANYRKH